MTTLEALARSLVPSETILILGAGASARSGAPTSRELGEFLGRTFGFNHSDYNLSELAGLVELNRSRRELVSALRDRLGKLGPAGGILNLPRYEWHSLYTTNFDSLIEQAYARVDRPIRVYGSDFDFTTRDSAAAAHLFKLHGSLESDISDGSTSRIIITEADYDQTKKYRGLLYDRLKADLGGRHLVIIGHSLQDPDIQDLTRRAAELQQDTHGLCRVSVLLYVPDPNRAQLLERKGLHVAFGSLDDFFHAIAAVVPASPAASTIDGPLTIAPALNPSTYEVSHELSAAANVSAMLNGRPASYSDIAAGATFARTVAEEAVDFLQRSESVCAVLLGAAGVGKTTAARQALLRLKECSRIVWEHRWDFTLLAADWLAVAKALQEGGAEGILFIDDAHSHLAQINELVETLAGNDVRSLKLLVASSQNLWQPRTKSPVLVKRGRVFSMGRLRPEEIERLLLLAETQPEIERVARPALSGFSSSEKRRRLTERCESEPFVCLKSIFATDSFDDILLREFATLDEAHQEVYRHVAAIQSAGIRVHRQLVIRVLGIPADSISVCLGHLAGVIDETTIDARQGLYGWQGRHPVIVAIISRYKYPDVTSRVKLFRAVIENASPSYPTEVRSLVEFCGSESGLWSIADRVVQNSLLGQIISVIPGEPVPRHRLISNLIEMGEYDRASTELRVFEKDLGLDGPASRYRAVLLRYRALRTPGVLKEDRVAILREALALAAKAAQRYRAYRALLVEYCEVAFQLFVFTGETEAYDAAIATLRAAGEESGEPEFGRVISRFEARMAGQEILGAPSPADEAL